MNVSTVQENTIRVYGPLNLGAVAAGRVASRGDPPAEASRTGRYPGGQAVDPPLP